MQTDRCRFSLGAFFGGIVAHYISRVQQFNAKALMAAVSVAVGAGVIGIFDYFGTGGSVAVWLYPVGLLIGGGLMGALAYPDEKVDSSDSKTSN